MGLTTASHSFVLASVDESMLFIELSRKLSTLGVFLTFRA